MLRRARVRPRCDGVTCGGRSRWLEEDWCLRRFSSVKASPWEPWRKRRASGGARRGRISGSSCAFLETVPAAWGFLGAVRAPARLWACRLDRCGALAPHRAHPTLGSCLGSVVFASPERPSLRPRELCPTRAVSGAVCGGRLPPGSWTLQETYVSGALTLPIRCRDQRVKCCALAPTPHGETR